MNQGRQEAELTEVVLARIGKPHGLQGQCTVQLFTDDPQQRFTPGRVLTTEPARRGPLTVASASVINKRWVLGFEEVGDRAHVEQLRDTLLTVQVDLTVLPEDPDEFYDYQLVGCTCFIGEVAVGTVSEVLHGPQDRLSIVDQQGKQTLIPFVKALVPQVDVQNRRILLTPPGGMFEQAHLGESE